MKALPSSPDFEVKAYWAKIWQSAKIFVNLLFTKKRFRMNRYWFFFLKMLILQCIRLLYYFSIFSSLWRVFWKVHRNCSLCTVCKDDLFTQNLYAQVVVECAKKIFFLLWNQNNIALNKYLDIVYHLVIILLVN